MWLLTPRGFFSAVEDRDDDAKLVVRTRTFEDLDALREILPHLVPIGGAGTDYPWRAWIDRREWAYALGVMAGEIDYPNFKDAVAECQGAARARVYGQVWSVLHQLQRREPG